MSREGLKFSSQPMRNLLKLPFDRVISLGANCACAFYMREACLRDASYPFDWLCNQPFAKRIELIENHFNKFLQFENLLKLDDDPIASEVARESGHRPIDDSSSGLRFLHDFDIGKPIEETYPTVRERFDRRIARFYESLSDDKRTLLVYWGHTEVITDETILEAEATLKRVFGKPIYLLVIESDSSVIFSKDVCLSPTTVKIRAPLFRGINPKKASFKGRKMTSIRIFHRIKKPGRPRFWWTNVIKMRVVHCLAQCIPMRKMRQRFKHRMMKAWNVLSF